MIPIVMGAPREDYERVAPPHSFIHADDFLSPREMAEYLHYLDRHDAAYNQYFRWRQTGHFIDTRFFCRLCAMLHDVRRTSSATSPNAVSSNSRKSERNGETFTEERQKQTGSVSWQKDLVGWWNNEQCIQPNMWASWSHANKHV